MVTTMLLMVIGSVRRCIALILMEWRIVSVSTMTAEGAGAGVLADDRPRKVRRRRWRMMSIVRIV
jgi:hypothetical protein